MSFKQDYNKTEIALGKKPGISNLYKYGLGAGIGATEREIWDNAPNAYYWMSAAAKIMIVSDDLGDNPILTGAHKVRIFGLDANWELQQEDITLNDVTPVESVNTYIRVFRAYVIEAGDITANLGTLSIYVTGVPANVVATIRPGEGQTHMVIYTVPAGYVMLVDNADANVGEGKQATVRLNTRENLSGKGTRLVKATRYLYQNSFTRAYKTPRLIDEKTDVWMSAQTAVSTVDVSASFEGRLFEKEVFGI